MSKIRQALYEAINPLTKIANGIIKKLNYIESSLIIKSKSYEEAKDFILKTASYHSNHFDDLTEEQQGLVAIRIYNTIHKILGKDPTEKPVEEANNEDELASKIYNYLRSNGGIMYPLETSARNLAKAISEK